MGGVRATRNIIILIKDMKEVEEVWNMVHAGREKLERISPIVRKILGGVIAAAILTPMSWQLYTHRTEVGAYLTYIDVRMLFVALSLDILDLGILASAWLLIANRLGITLGFHRDLKAFFFSNLAKRIPGMVWYLAGRAYLYRTVDGGIWIATTGTILENSLLALCGLLLALILLPQLGLNVWVLFALPSVALISLVLSLRPATLWEFARLFQHRDKIRPTAGLLVPTRDILLWFTLYMLVWIVGGFAFHCFVVAFYPALTLASFPFTLGVSTAYSLSGLIAFLLPAGLGIKELTGVYLLSHLLPAPLAIVIVLLFRVKLLLAEGFWLVLSYCFERWKQQPYR